MEATGEQLREHSYCMGRQLEYLGTIMAMHWRNMVEFQAYESVQYAEEDFDSISTEYSDVISHNGLIRQYEGK